MLLGVLFRHAHCRRILAQQRSYEQLGTATPQVPAWFCPALGCKGHAKLLALLFSFLSHSMESCDGRCRFMVIFTLQKEQQNCTESSSSFAVVSSFQHHALQHYLLKPRVPNLQAPETTLSHQILVEQPNPHLQWRILGNLWIDREDVKYVCRNTPAAVTLLSS